MGCSGEGVDSKETMMKKLWIGLAVMAAMALPMAAVAQNGKGKGDNKDDQKSGKVDRKGDGNSGQGDDLHKKDKHKDGEHGDGCCCPKHKRPPHKPGEGFDGKHRPPHKPPMPPGKRPDFEPKKKKDSG